MTDSGYLLATRFSWFDRCSTTPEHRRMAQLAPRAVRRVGTCPRACRAEARVHSRKWPWLEVFAGRWLCADFHHYVGIRPAMHACLTALLLPQICPFSLVAPCQRGDSRCVTVITEGPKLWCTCKASDASFFLKFLPRNVLRCPRFVVISHTRGPHDAHGARHTRRSLRIDAQPC